MKKLLALLMIWLLLPIAGAEEAYTMQDGSLILLDGAGRKCQPIAMKPDFPEARMATCCAWRTGRIWGIMSSAR